MYIEKYIQTKPYKILQSIGLIAIFFGFTVNSSAQNQRQTIQITTEFNYPYNFLDKDTGAISGRAADKVHEIFKRSQIPYRMQIMSWNRAFEMARGNADTCVFSTSRSGEREPLFQWIGPIAVGHWAMFGSPDKLGKITKLEDIKQSRIGTQFGTIGVAYLSERHFQVVTSTESITTFKNVAVVFLICGVGSILGLIPLADIKSESVSLGWKCLLISPGAFWGAYYYYERVKKRL